MNNAYLCTKMHFDANSKLHLKKNMFLLPLQKGEILKMKKTCVLAYSGGLDTSAIIPWLKENYDFKVIAYCSDVGNLPSVEELKTRAMTLGADDFVFEDAKSEFVSDYVFPMLKAGATYFDDYMLGTAIARPVISKKLADYAKSVKASCIAHGATGKGNDHVRFEKTWAYLLPDVEIIAPWKIWNYRSRNDIAAYLKTHNYPWDDVQKEYSVDLNLFHRSCEGGILEDLESSFAIPKICDWLKDADPLAKPEVISIAFDKGIPVSINQKNIKPHEMLEKLNTLGGKFGIGFCDIVEERANGIKSRGVYETPGGTILHMATKEIKRLCWSKELYLAAQVQADTFGKLIYDGNWFTDLRLATEAFFNQAAEVLTGEIKLELSHNMVRPMMRMSKNSLYNMDVVSFQKDTDDVHKASKGYTQILTLPMRMQGQRDQQK